MSNFNDEYYFILKQQDDRIPGMTPDTDTAEREFRYTKMPLASKPLVFHNGTLDRQQANHIKPMDPPPDLLFCGSDVLVNETVRDALRHIEIPNLAIQPSVYIDHKNVWYENYWYLTFLAVFDCWDRKASTYDPEPLTLRGERYEVYTYSLDEDVLGRTPLAERQLFKMGGTTNGMIVVHQSLKTHFQGSGADLVPIVDYGIYYP